MAYDFRGLAATVLTPFSVPQGRRGKHPRRQVAFADPLTNSTPSRLAIETQLRLPTLSNAGHPPCNSRKMTAPVISIDVVLIFAGTNIMNVSRYRLDAIVACSK
jgi:hypothetical protein